MTDNQEVHICEYGCNRPAIIQFGNGKGKWCCSKSQNSCPAKKERARLKSIGVKNTPPQPIETNKVCSFGCNKQAKFIYKTGSLCCSDDWHRCPGQKENISARSTKIWSDLDRRKRLSETQRKDLIAVAIPVTEEGKVCKDCGEQAKFFFKTNNRYCCSDRIERCPEAKKKTSIRFKLLWKTSEFRQKMFESQDYSDPIRRKKLSVSLKRWCKMHPYLVLLRGKKISETIAGKSWEELMGKERFLKRKELMRKKMLGKTWIERFGFLKANIARMKSSRKLLGRKETRKEILIDMSEKKKDHWSDPNSSYNSKEFRLKKSRQTKKQWKDPVFVKKIQQSLHNSPNGPERQLIELFKELELNYKFVGDWSLNINGRNPDFINYKSKKLIEHFGIYYHDKIVDLSREEHEKERIDFFKKYGYKTLIIWEDEWINIDKIKDKILNFNVE